MYQRRKGPSEDSQKSRRFIYTGPLCHNFSLLFELETEQKNKEKKIYQAERREVGKRDRERERGGDGG